MAVATKFPRSIRWAFNFKNWQPTEYEWGHAIMQVQEEERVRIGKFRYRDDAKASLIGRLMMRLWSKQFLSAVGCSNPKPSFERNKSGRPNLIISDEQKEFTLDLNFDFNVAHAGELTVFVAEVSKTTCVAVGVDVMPLTSNRRDLNLDEFLRLMKRQFTDDEWSQIRKLPRNCNDKTHQIMKNFYRFWSLKESFVKAEGSGLAWDLQRLSFSCPNVNLENDSILTDTILTIDGNLKDGWQFQECLLASSHWAAVAVNIIDNDYIVPWVFVELKDLLDLTNNKNTNSTFLNADDRKREWEMFVSKEINKPF